MSNEACRACGYELCTCGNCHSPGCHYAQPTSRLCGGFTLTPEEKAATEAMEARMRAYRKEHGLPMNEEEEE